MAFEKIEFKKVIGELTERKPINKCAFEFADNPTKVYYSGQLICGIVHLTLNENMKTKNIFANVIGKAYVRWIEYMMVKITEHTKAKKFSLTNALS